MIYFQKAQKAFKEYLKQYDLEDGSVNLKVVHTYGVVDKSEYIAKELGLDEENIELAKLIALLHDIGRFEQVKLTKDFDDSKGFEHANYGVKVLFEDGLIRNFVDNSKYDEVIRKAIYNHNKYQIEEGLNEQELLHSKIIRDADKLDNFRVKETEHFKNIFPGKYNPETLEYETISDRIYEDILNHKCIKITDRKTQIDFWAGIIAFIFDLNFDVSLKYIYDKNYVDILIDRIEYKNADTKEKMEIIRKDVKEYLRSQV